MTISPSYPYTLTNGTTADATQVMADFLQIQNDVNANAAHNGANSDITSITGLTTALGIAYGGTGSTTASAARTALGLGAAAVEALGNNIVDDGAGNLELSPTAVLATGVTATTQSPGNNTTKVATTAFVAAAAAALLVSPAFTGIPTAPTAAANTNTTQLATTANVVATIAATPFIPAAFAVGAYVMGAVSGGIAAGATTAGTNITVYGFTVGSGNGVTGDVLTGTWQAMQTQNSSFNAIGLLMRVS